jgi:hypothetical protein
MQQKIAILYKAKKISLTISKKRSISSATLPQAMGKRISSTLRHMHQKKAAVSP